MKKYRLDLTDEQAKTTSYALELYSRLRMGQWAELIDLCLDFKDDDYAHKKFDVLIPELMRLRKEVYPELSPNWGHSYGVGKFEDADLAWEIHEVLRNKIAWTEHPEGGNGVDFGKPMSFRGNELAECSLIDNNEKK